MAIDPAFALAEHVVGTRFEDLPRSAIIATNRDVLDTFGCILGGSGAPASTISLRCWRNGAGSLKAGFCCVAGLYRRRTPR